MRTLYISIVNWIRDLLRREPITRCWTCWEPGHTLRAKVQKGKKRYYCEKHFDKG